MIVKSVAYRDATGLFLSWSLCLLCSLAGIASAETINVAVASNFVTTLEQLTLEFEARTDHRVNLISGSSGKHYAQIINGAPFDLFLSAEEQIVFFSAERSQSGKRIELTRR